MPPVTWTTNGAGVPVALRLNAVPNDMALPGNNCTVIGAPV